MIFAEATRQEWLADLQEFLRIPSVSTLPEYQPEVRRAAAFNAAQLQKAGLANVRLIEGVGHPLVYGEWLGAPRQPTVLFYGHYDVQPAEPLELWQTPPFEPAIRNNNIYARGAADDKGQVLLQIKALQTLLQRDGKLPVNVRVLIEGEEEVGGEHLERFLQHEAKQVPADVALICDSELFAPDLPTLCVGLRGIVYGELQVRGAAQDLHSGVYGGAAPNPLEAIAHLIAALKSRDGRILIPGFYDAVQPPSAPELIAWARLPFQEEEYRRTEVGSPALVGEPGFSVLERTWARPTLEVHGIRGGFTGEGAKTVIPAEAVAKISLRLVPDQTPEQVVEQLRAAIAAACPPGVTAEFCFLHGAPPSLVDPNNQFVQVAARALQGVFGRETVFIRSGGSIPVVNLLQQHLGIPSVLMGFGLPDDNIHAPNEKFHLPNFFLGVQSVARWLEMLAAV